MSRNQKVKSKQCDKKDSGNDSTEQDNVKRNTVRSWTYYRDICEDV